MWLLRMGEYAVLKQTANQNYNKEQRRVVRQSESYRRASHPDAEKRARPRTAPPVVGIHEILASVHAHAAVAPPSFWR
jgi:hypothetical protein